MEYYEIYSYGIMKTQSAGQQGPMVQFSAFIVNAAKMQSHPRDERETFVELSISYILESANRKFHMHIPSSPSLQHAINAGF